MNEEIHPHLLINVVETLRAHPETDFSMCASVWNQDPEEDWWLETIRPGDHVNVWDAFGHRLMVKVMTDDGAGLLIGRVLVEKPDLHYTTFIRFAVENVYDIHRAPDFTADEGEQ